MTAFSASLSIDRASLDAVVNLDSLVAKAMPDVSREMRTAAIETFRSASDPWSHPWPPLAETTLERRRARGNTRTSPLVDSGQMFDTIDNSSTANSATVEIGAGLPDPRAPANLLGTSKIPQRAVFPVHHDGTVDLPDSYVERVSAPISRAIEKATQ